MLEKAGFPYGVIILDRDGNPVREPAMLSPDGTSDVIVLTHGWKNDEDNADQLYDRILQHVRTGMGPAGTRAWAAVGVHWPSFTYRDDLTLLEPDPEDYPMLGAAADLDAAGVSREELQDFARQVGEFLQVSDDDAFICLALEATGGGGASGRLLDMIRGVICQTPDQQTRSEHAQILEMPGGELYEQLRGGGSVEVAWPGNVRGAEPLAGATLAREVHRYATRTLAGLRSGGVAAIARILNQATYFEMKARSGVIGQGLAKGLAKWMPPGTRIHLVGHSFGARAVSAAAAADENLELGSLSLLQAAYSHNGLGKGFGNRRGTVGAFRPIIDNHRVKGPILVTHTLRDRAVGVAYALASTVTSEIASGLGTNSLVGGPMDVHGGMGANGAQSMLDGEAVWLSASTTSVPTLRCGYVNNVLSDEVISGHNDVDNQHVGALVWAALSSNVS